jgi:hypothetical protein
MSTLAEIELAVPHLAAEELSQLERLIHSLRVRRSKTQLSAFDLEPLDLGKVLKPLSAEDDLLEEMLDDSRD